ncbi:hypothetical protein Tco_0149310 [Tanacetum coccineum]
MKEAVHVALQAPLRNRFRELPKADMKEILHQRMFETGTYKSLPKHVDLYEALKASMEWANRDEFLAEKDNLPAPHIWLKIDKSTKELLPTPSSKTIKPRPDWLKPIPEEDKPETPEPNWSISSNNLPEPENNWANTLANSYKDLEENKLLRKTGDMGSFITWFYKKD